MDYGYLKIDGRVMEGTIIDSSLEGDSLYLKELPQYKK